MYWLVIAWFVAPSSGLVQERFHIATPAACERIGKASVDFLNKSGRLVYVDYTCIPVVQKGD